MPPAKNLDLHGNAPDCASAVLLMVDVINDMEYEGGDKLFEQALPMAGRLAALKRRARAAGLPVIYANDNFGRWRSDFREVVGCCLARGVTGRPLAELLAPEDDDYVVLKPKQSAFYATPLAVLLRQLDVDDLIITGIAGDGCVLVTAYDAHLREFRVHVPEDCTASQTRARNRRALQQIRAALDGDTRPSNTLLEHLQQPPPAPGERRRPPPAHRGVH